MWFVGSKRSHAVTVRGVAGLRCPPDGSAREKKTVAANAISGILGSSAAQYFAHKLGIDSTQAAEEMAKPLPGLMDPLPELTDPNPGHQRRP
jgi:hypothetical protein